MSKIYTTVMGDMWDNIAKAQMGSEKYMAVLMEANTAYEDVSVFPAGIVLTIPSVSTPRPESLPPWKR